MSDNTVIVKYVGAAAWFESSVTGRPTKWLPNQSDYVSPDVAIALAATGLFKVGSENPVMAVANPVTGGIDLIGPGGEIIEVGSGQDAAVQLSGSRALTDADSGKTLEWSGDNDIALTTIVGLSEFSVLQTGKGRVSVTGAAGIAQTSFKNYRLKFVESDGYTGAYETVFADYLTTAEKAETVQSVPLSYIGDRVVFRGVPLTWVTPNGKVGRYVADNGHRLAMDYRNDNLAVDTATGYVELGRVTIPGGVLQRGDAFTVLGTLSCPAQFGSTSTQAIIELSQPENSLTHRFYSPVSSATATGFSFNHGFAVTAANIVRLLPAATMFAEAGASEKRINTLSDIVVKILIKYATSTGTKVSSLTNEVARVVITPSVKSAPLDLSTYRNADEQPFEDRAFWNLPIPDGATYESNTDAATALLITPNPGGYNAGAYPWVQGAQSSGVSVVYLQDDMPLMNVTYTARNPGAPWPFKATAVTNGTFKYPMPDYEIPRGQTSDAIVVLITPDRRYCIETGGYSFNATTGTHSCGYMNVIDLYGSGISALNTSPGSTTLIDASLSYQSEAYRASGHPVLGGLIRKEDIDAGEINHMLCCQLSQLQLRAAAFKVVSASGTTLQIRALDKYASESADVNIDYSSIFPAGGSVAYAGNSYTVDAAGSTYSAGVTSIPVTASLTGSATVAYSATTQLGRRGTVIAWPATQCDSAFDQISGTAAGSAGTYRGLIPIGAVVAIPPSVDLSTLGLTPEGLMVATAFQKYGGVCNDTAHYTFNVVFLDAQLQGTSAANNIVDDIETIRDQLRVVTNYNRTTAFQKAREYAAGKPVVPLIP